MTADPKWRVGDLDALPDAQRKKFLRWCGKAFAKGEVPSVSLGDAKHHVEGALNDFYLPAIAGRKASGTQSDALARAPGSRLGKDVFVGSLVNKVVEIASKAKGCHGLLAYAPGDDAGTFTVPTDGPNASQGARALFDRAATYLRVVQASCPSYADLCALEQELKQRKVAQLVASGRIEVLSKGRALFEAESDLISRLCRPAYAAAKHERAWMGLADETLGLRLDLMSLQERHHLMFAELTAQEGNGLSKRDIKRAIVQFVQKLNSDVTTYNALISMSGNGMKVDMPLQRFEDMRP